MWVYVLRVREKERAYRDALRAHFHQGFCALAEGPGSVDHVVDNDAVFAVDFADNIHAFYLPRPRSMLYLRRNHVRNSYMPLSWSSQAYGPVRHTVRSGILCRLYARVSCLMLKERSLFQSQCLCAVCVRRMCFPKNE